jgi:pimeloyl-ACP methyl ester carboxylesterase
MGARAAVHFAAMHPARVAGLALIDTHFMALAGEDVAAFREKVRDHREGRAYPSYAAALAAYRLVPEEPGVPEAVLRDVAHHALVERAPGEWWVRFDRGVLLGDGADDLFAALGRLRCPVRVAYASRAPDDRSEIETLRARCPRVRVDVLEGGHHMFLARPGPTGDWLAEFLDALPRGA